MYCQGRRWPQSWRRRQSKEHWIGSIPTPCFGKVLWTIILIIEYVVTCPPHPPHRTISQTCIVRFLCFHAAPLKNVLPTLGSQWRRYCWLPFFFCRKQFPCKPKDYLSFKKSSVKMCFVSLHSSQISCLAEWTLAYFQTFPDKGLWCTVSSCSQVSDKAGGKWKW